MRFTLPLLAAALSCPLLAATPPIDISLAHGTPPEAQTRDQLNRLFQQYDLGDWIWTRKVVVEHGVIPHSHPVLTLNTRHLGDDLALLSTFVHEQYHWYETAHEAETSAAIAELKAQYPGLPVGGLDGAADENSSYLHVIVCFAEWQEMKNLVGPGRARQIMDVWSHDHYRAIYRFVLDHEGAISAIARRHNLFPPQH